MQSKACWYFEEVGMAVGVPRINLEEIAGCLIVDVT